MTNDLKLVVESTAEGARSDKPESVSPNPMDALNRRDIELIKKSLVGMHRNCADLRETMVALHRRNNTVPSKGFFIGMGLVWFIAIGVLTASRPQLEAAFRHVPTLARSSADATP